MNTRLVLAISLFSGLAGGLVSHYAFPGTAFAQSPSEIRVQSLVLVDGQNNEVGKITTTQRGGGNAPNAVRRDDPPSIVILDCTGREVWRASGAMIRPLSVR